MNLNYEETETIIRGLALVAKRSKSDSLDAVMALIEKIMDNANKNLSYFENERLFDYYLSFNLLK